MLPQEHFLAAAIPIIGYCVARYRRLPSKGLMSVVFVGSQFPDLVDKPLAHTVPILPSGRVFMHSLPFAIPICILVIWYGIVTDRPALSDGFVLAYLIHLFTDWQHMLLAGELPPNLFWPFMKPLPSPVEPFWAGPGGINVSLWTIFSIVVLSGTLLLVAMDISHQLSETKR